MLPMHLASARISMIAVSPFQILEANNKKSVPELIALLQSTFGMTKKQAKVTIYAWSLQVLR